jgi:Aldehyde dehydrogenase family
MAVDEQLEARSFSCDWGRWYGQARPDWLRTAERIETPSKQASRELGAFLEANHPRMLHFGIYIDDDAYQMTVIYALGGSVFARRRGLELARRMRSGMTAVNSVLSFAAMPSLPYGGVGDSGFGRMGGDDGLREFARSKAITTRRAPLPLPAWTFERDPDATARRVMAVMRLLHGRSRLAQPPSTR